MGKRVQVGGGGGGVCWGAKKRKKDKSVSFEVSGVETFTLFLKRDRQKLAQKEPSESEGSDIITKHRWKKFKKPSRRKV